MAVQLTWSTENGGTAIADDYDFGSIANAAESAAQTFYVRHDGVSSITDAGFYVRRYSGDYSGSTTAETDFQELMAWGDTSDPNEYGGFWMNLDALGGFPAGEWPSTIWAKSVLSGLKIVGVCCRTGVGGDSRNTIPVITEMGCSVDGEIQAGASPNVRFNSKLVIPINEDTTGWRMFEVVLAYNYTS